MKIMVSDLQSSPPYWQDMAEGDYALIQSAQFGRLEAFNSIVLKYQDALYRTALGILGQEDPAADALQETFISAYQHLDQFRGGSLKSWLMRIVVNKCYDAARRSQSHATISLEEAHDDQNESENESLYGRLQEQTASVETIVETRQIIETILACLSNLPIDFRIIVVLVDIEEMSYVDASTVLKIPVGTVKSRLARARDQLRQVLRTHGEI